MKINRTIFLLFFLLFFSLATQELLGQEGFVVQRVKIKGNKAFYDSKLKTVIKLKGTDIYQRWILRKERQRYYSESLLEDQVSLRSFYQKEGFLDFKYDSVRVTPHGKKNKVRVVFYLNVGKPYTFGNTDIVINQGQLLEDYFKHQSLRTKLFNLQTKKGNRFADVAVYADQAEISRWFADEGYPYSELTKDIRLDSVARTADISWHVNTGPLSHFGKVGIVGMEHISEKIIRKNVTCVEGALYSRKDAEDTQRRIVDLGAFNVVTITPVLSATKSDTVPMMITVGESPRLTTRFGLGYGKEERLRAFMKIQKIGVFGGARRGEFNARASYLEPYNFSFKFTQPGFVFPLTSLVLYPYVARQSEVGYKLTKFGGSVILQKSFSKYLITALSYNYEAVRLDTTSVARVDQEPLLVTNYTKAGFALATVYDNTYPKFDPISGYVASFNAKMNGLLIRQEFPFYKMSVGYKKFTVPLKKWVLASKIQFGSIFLIDGGEVVPVEERYFSGGVGSMRGWSRQNLGPKDDNGIPTGGRSIMEAGVELRVPLISPLKAVTFLEAGNVWDKSFYWNLKELRYTWGCGLRIASPIGPIGFDVATPIFDQNTTWQFLINIGPSF